MENLVLVGCLGFLVLIMFINTLMENRESELQNQIAVLLGVNRYDFILYKSLFVKEIKIRKKVFLKCNVQNVQMLYDQGFNFEITDDD